MAVTPDVDYFTLAGVVGAMVGDAADADKNPDWATATEGTVTLTPTVDLVHVTDTTSGKTVAMVPFPVVCTIDAQGRITYNGDLSVTLLDLGSSKVNPSVPRNKAAYNVVFAGVKMDTATVKITSFGINPSAADAGGDGSIVLWDLQPLPTSTGGAAIARGMGVPSVTSATDGDVVTYDGTDIVWAAPTGGGGGGATTLDGLTDVNTSGVTDGQALIWDAGTSSWSVGSIVQPGDLATIATTGSADNLIDGTTNKAYTATEKTKLAAITGTNTGDETAATIKTKLGITTLSGSNTGDQTSVSGNAGTATKLATARAINGVSFDGTADITVADATKVPTTRMVAGHALSADVTLAKADVGLGSADNTADTAKNVLSATKLTTARTIDGQAFDGTANVTVIAPGTHAATGKTTPADADELPIVDSAASNVLKKLTWANLKTAIAAGLALATVAFSGSAADLSTGLLPLDRLPAGSTITIVSTTSWPARPTSRTDIFVRWLDEGGLGTTPPGMFDADTLTAAV